MKLCDYGCGQEGKYQLKNDKWCCSKSYNSCPITRRKRSRSLKRAWKNTSNGFYSDSRKEKRSKSLKEAWENSNSKYNSNSRKEKLSNKMKEAWENPNSGLNSILWKKKQYKSLKLTIKKINKKYPFFSKVEEIRYNPDNIEEIQVHCKNHECENSKEKGGWFTPNRNQLTERVRQLESKEGSGGCYFYCSQECKDICPLYNLHGDPFKNSNLPYTPDEYQTFRTFVLDRDNYICQFCGKPATDVHHERPQKLEPFYALDPDFAWSCCEKCHYKKGHKDECSTGNLAKIVCSVESQKFLNQKLESPK